MKKQIWLAVVCLITNLGVFAQEEQEFTVPLSDPGKPGTLVASMHRGSIRVEGYNGKEVKIKVVTAEEDEDRDTRRSGLRRIPNAAAQFDIEERNNVVTISGIKSKRVDFMIMVPEAFSLNLKTHHDGFIGVKNVKGNIEADGHHEDIEMSGISGSVVADTHHGEITVAFDDVERGTPMAFSTYHGDIDITLPDDVNSSAKIKTTKGEVYTDFDLDLKVEVTNVDSRRGEGTKIQVGGWLKGDLGSGGAEYMFSSYHGDVIIRKN
ncbi:MAG: hypothetical protein R8G66_29655 [Cytophagales bacterium]|nr:hypothetical protein [Cytophagales bacterium]